VGKTVAGRNWDDVKRDHPVGSAVTGTVVRAAPFGVFVDLGIGFSGLLRVPEMAGDGRKRVEDYPQTGETVIAKVLWHDDRNQQLALTQRA
jgi:ribosomal protein S1